MFHNDPFSKGHPVMTVSNIHPQLDRVGNDPLPSPPLPLLVTYTYDGHLSTIQESRTKQIDVTRL